MLVCAQDSGQQGSCLSQTQEAASSSFLGNLVSNLSLEQMFLENGTEQLGLQLLCQAQMESQGPATSGPWSPGPPFEPCY